MIIYILYISRRLFFSSTELICDSLAILRKHYR